ncbi:MAG TPA: choice-of-anchor D domain-containing protein [Myxococcota bacterium]|nr:choice-of-anchor D domain-containing protein [Myxococcota bacterium]HRY95483.1 choice-of-anchor D domain-containing protein [Myxococcota bacterium]HSA22465.1 choice-of-anchor D domain-containing protein [Myxococcota bacterium]
MRLTRTVVALSGLLLLLATNACDCDDSQFGLTSPLIERYFVGTQPEPPALELYQPIPEGDAIPVPFGTVDVGTMAHRYLLVRNEGQGDLQLAGVTPDPANSGDVMISCLDGGSMKPDCPYTLSETLSVGPGRDLILDVAYAPGEPGGDQASFVLLFNTALHTQLTVNVTGEGVTPEVQVCFQACTGGDGEPACQGVEDMCNDQVEKDQFILDFGDVEMDQQKSRRVTVRNLGQKALTAYEVALVIRQGTGMQVDLGATLFPFELAVGASFDVTVQFAPPWGGEFRDSLRVSTTDVSEPEIEFPVLGRGVAPRVCPEPAVLDFGALRVGEVVTLPIDLRSCGLEALHLDDVRPAAGTSPDFSLISLPALPSDLAPEAVVQVQVQYAPQGPGSDRGGVEIYSNDQSSDPVTGLSGTVVLLGRAVDAACDIQVTPFAVSFGVVPIDSSNETDLIISNVGSDTCVIDRVELSVNSAAQEFGLVSAPAMPLSLQPADASPTPVKISYHPTDLGQDVGTLSIFANDKDGDETRVDINGFARPDGDGPIAVCSGSPAQALPFDNVVWDGSRSYDTSPARTITEYRWNIFAFPPGSAARLLGTGPNRTTSVDLAGDYIASLVVVNDIGQQSQICYAQVNVAPSQELWIEMYWTLTNDDMDLHLLAPNGIPRTRSDCYYANCVPTPFGTLEWGQAGVAADNPRLDLDDIPGDGPENINIPVPASGRYTVFVHDYPGSENYASNGVTVNVYINGALMQTFTHSTSGEDSDWYVCDIDWPSGTITPR